MVRGLQSKDAAPSYETTDPAVGWLRKPGRWRTDGTPYGSIIRCRCLDCGQGRIDKEYA